MPKNVQLLGMFFRKNTLELGLFSLHYSRKPPEKQEQQPAEKGVRRQKPGDGMRQCKLLPQKELVLVKK